MLLKSFLLSGVASIALINFAVAQDARPKVTIEVTGAYSMGQNNAAQNFLGLPFNSTVTSQSVGPLSGGYAAIAVGVEFMPLWDLTGRFSGSVDRGTTTYVSSGFFTGGTLEDTFNSQAVDAELGFTPELDDAFDLRVFVGARGLHYTDRQLQTSEKVGFPPSSTDLSNEFYGFGPRAGVQMAYARSGSIIGVSGSAAGGVLFGKETATATTTFLGIPFGTTTAAPVARAVVNLEGSLGLDLHVTPNVTITGGYRAELYSAVHQFNGVSSSHLVHGPFVTGKGTF